MKKWIAEFELEDGDTMPEHMELDYMETKNEKPLAYACCSLFSLVFLIYDMEWV